MARAAKTTAVFVCIGKKDPTHAIFTEFERYFEDSGFTYRVIDPDGLGHQLTPDVAKQALAFWDEVAADVETDQREGSGLSSVRRSEHDRVKNILPNINDDVEGKSPDAGAIEYGKPVPRYGPREGGNGQDRYEKYESWEDRLTTKTTTTDYEARSFGSSTVVVHRNGQENEGERNEP